MLFKKKQQSIGIDIQKNILRYCTIKRGQFIFGEKAINGSFFKDSKLRNAPEFIAVLQKISSELHMRNPNFVISAMNSKLLIRQIPLQNMSTEKEIREYLYFELGESIPLPFENPIFDLLVLGQGNKKSSNQKKIKQPKEAVKKGKKITIQRNRLTVNGNVPVIITSEPILEELGDSIVKSGGQLVGVDCSSLAYTRIFQKKINWGQDFLLVELDSGTATLTIFEQLVPVYVQYEDYNQVNWKYLETDHVVKTDFPTKIELEGIESLGATINNVVRYFEAEISSGKQLEQIYLVGGHPLLKKEVEEIIQRENNGLPVKALKSPYKMSNQKRVPEKFLLAAGLAMKEV